MWAKGNSQAKRSLTVFADKGWSRKTNNIGKIIEGTNDVTLTCNLANMAAFMVLGVVNC